MCSIYLSSLLLLLLLPAKSLQLCPALWDPIDGSPPGSSVPGILQARTLEWVAISFSNAWRWKVEVKSLSCVWLLVTVWTAAYQAPPSMGFSRQEYCSGVLLPSSPEQSRGKKKDPESDNRIPSHSGTSVLATNLMREFSECLIWDPGCILEGWREDKKKEGKGILLILWKRGHHWNVTDTTEPRCSNVYHLVLAARLGVCWEVSHSTCKVFT